MQTQGGAGRNYALSKRCLHAAMGDRVLGILRFMVGMDSEVEAVDFKYGTLAGRMAVAEGFSVK